MTKENYLQIKKEYRIRFAINIVLGIIAGVFYIQILLSHSREVPFFITCLGTLTFINQSLIAPVFYEKKAAEKEHPEWKNLSTKGVEIPQEEIQKRNRIAILSFIIVIVGFLLLYRPAPKTDVGTEIIKTHSEIRSVLDNPTEKESNSPTNSSSLDLNKAKDFVEKAQQQNWLKRGE